MNGALLDGKHVGAAAIDPAQHRFLGMFRPADVVPAGNYGLLLCPCGSHLSTNEQIREHWRSGCRDVPQYVTIDEKTNVNGVRPPSGANPT